MQQKNLPKDYTKLGTVLQLHLPMDIEYSIPKDNPVWLVRDGVERMNLGKLFSTDATFMRMKEDAMLNGQLKPGYNIQFAVDAEYVVWTGESPWPTDVKTLIPFLEDLREHLGSNYRKIVADAGYESEENYEYLLKNGMISFIKPNNYEIFKKHSFQDAIWRRENMAYDAATDSYLCANGKQVKCEGTKKRKSRSGYVIENTVDSWGTGI